MREFVFSALALGAFAFLPGCGSSTTAAPLDAGIGVDGSTGGGSDGGSTVDSAVGEDAAPDAGPNCHPVGVTQSVCRTCCANAFPAGSTVFDKYTLTCACGASYCGPPDGGAAEAGGDDAGDAGVTDGGDDGATDAAAADGGLFGNGVCAATCNQVAPPDPTCNTCILATLGSVSSLGPCGSVVLGQCLSDTTCNQYFGCIENCP